MTTEECTIVDSDKYKDAFKKDCPDYEHLPTILPAVDKIIAIGDLHGDYKLMTDTLLLVKVIDKDYNWCGKNAVVVQVGDQVDRCRPTDGQLCNQEGTTKDDEGSDIKIMEFLTNLHKQAVACGGAVYSLLGNHELMNVTGHLNYVSLEGLKQFENYVDENGNKIKDGYEARKYAFSPGKQYARFMGCSRMAVLIIGSNIFIHAGILPKYAHKLKLKGRKGLEKINKRVRRWLLGRLDEKYKGYVDEIISSSKSSMFWNRVLGSLPPNINSNDPRCEEHVKPVLELFHLNHMIIGHTPQFYVNNDGMNKTCGYGVWRIDNGGSHAFQKFDPAYTVSPEETSHSRVPQALIITNDKEFKVVSLDDTQHH